MTVILLSLFSVITIVRTFDLFNTSLEKRIKQCIMEPKDISDKKLMIDGPLDFVYDNGYRRSRPRYIDGVYIRWERIPNYRPPPNVDVKNKTLDMMKQTIYNTQDRIKEYNEIFAKYSASTAFRMSFLFNRLKQLIIDLRRIYTVSLKLFVKKRVFEQIYWYTHAFRKFVDVLYLVEYIININKEHRDQIDRQAREDKMDAIEQRLKDAETTTSDAHILKNIAPEKAYK